MRGHGPGTPGQRAAARIGEWPRVSGKANGLADEHARTVWTAGRSGVVDRAGSLWALVDGDPVAFGGQVDLAFLATVGGHLRRCDRCALRWVDGEVPLDLLTAAVRRTRAWEVFRPVLREIRAAGSRLGRRGGI